MKTNFKKGIMDYIVKILVSLKKGELTFAMTVLINAIQIYIVCFFFIDNFKSFDWYQELLLPLAISISYTFMFLLFFMFSCIIFLSETPQNRFFAYLIFKSDAAFYYSICPLSFSLLYQIFKLVYIDDFSFSLEKYVDTIIYVIIYFLLSPLLFLLLNKVFKEIRIYYSKIYNAINH